MFSGGFRIFSRRGGFLKQFRQFCRPFFRSSKLIFRTLSEHLPRPSSNRNTTKKFAPQAKVFKCRFQAKKNAVFGSKIPFSDTKFQFGRHKMDVIK